MAMSISPRWVQPSSPPTFSRTARRQPAAAPRPTHTIRDGDTLAGIAQQYLGQNNRAYEIFQLNRDRLVSVDLLPIGTVLRLPPKQAAPPRARCSQRAELGHSSSAESVFPWRQARDRKSAYPATRKKPHESSKNGRGKTWTGLADRVHDPWGSSDVGRHPMQPGSCAANVPRGTDAKSGIRRELD